MIPGWIFAGSIPGPNQSYRAFPGLLFAEFRQGRGNHMTAGQAVQPVIVGNIDGFLLNHASNIALSLLPETAIELVVDFNPHHPDLPAGMNREWWT